MAIAMPGFNIKVCMVDCHCWERKCNTPFCRNQDTALKIVCLCFNHSFFAYTSDLDIILCWAQNFRAPKCRVLQEAGILRWLAFVLPLSLLENSLKCDGKKRRYTGYTYVFHIPWEEIIFSLETSFLSFFAWRIHRRLQVKWYLTA